MISVTFIFIFILFFYRKKEEETSGWVSHVPKTEDWVAYLIETEFNWILSLPL